MSTEVTRAVGNPVRRAALHRVLRSNVIATALVMWTIAVTGLVGAVVVHHTGTDRPFHASDAAPPVMGQAAGQWWVVSLVVGALILMPVLVAWLLAGPREQAVVASWRTSLVTNRQIVLGTLEAVVECLVLAVIATLPAAAMALALGGTSPAQLAVGAAGAIATGIVAGSIAIAVSCCARRTSRALFVTYLLFIALLAGTTVAHGLRAGDAKGHRADAVLIANPLVGVADAAAPQAAKLPGGGAAEAPLVHLRNTVHPTASPVAPWLLGAIGDAVVTLLALAVAMLRLRRSGRH